MPDYTMDLYGNWQGELDLDGKTIESQWRRNEIAQAKDWTDEALCIQWVWPGSDWSAHKDWWDNLPSYERSHLLSVWRWEHDKNPPFRRTYRQYMAGIETFHQQVEELAQVWARDIREAAKRGEPMPITPAANNAIAVCAFDRACDLAGVLVIMSNAQGDSLPPRKENHGH